MELINFHDKRSEEVTRTDRRDHLGAINVVYKFTVQYMNKEMNPKLDFALTKESSKEMDAW